MIRFIYSGDIYNQEREKVVENLASCVALIVPLPEEIEIEFKKLDPSTYGDLVLDPRFPNRIRLAESLSTREVIRPLVHELLHLNQVFTGRLSSRRDGTYIWEGRPYSVKSVVTIQEWASLPWEQDVTNRLNHTLSKAMNLGIIKG